MTRHPEKLNRRLKAHLSLGFPLAILDGSDGQVPIDLPDSDRIFLIRRPNSSISDRLLEALDYCSHPYIIHLSDDDLFSGSTLHECMNFLENNPDYVAAQGVFWIDQPSGLTMEEFSPSMDISDPTERFLRYFGSYSHIAYSVQRRDVFECAVKNAALFWGHGCYFELAQAATIVASGKVKRLLCPHALRCPHTVSEAQDKFRNHPLSWRQREPEVFDFATDRFVEVLSQQPPFASWHRTKSILKSAIDRYLEAAVFENNIPHKHRYLLFLLQALNPKSNPVEIVSHQSRATQDQLYNSLHSALEFLFRSGKTLGLPESWLPDALGQDLER